MAATSTVGGTAVPGRIPSPDGVLVLVLACTAALMLHVL
jgi:hypothetical protein